MTRPSDEEREDCEVWRCLITENPVGTDTMRVGDTCVCQVCCLVSAIEAAREEGRQRADEAACKTIADEHEHGYKRGHAAGVAEAVEGLGPRITHRMDCFGPCTCGLDAALARLRKGGA